MNRNSVHEVIVSVAENGLSPRHLPHQDSLHSSHLLSTPSSTGISGEKGGERSVCEDTNDDIWEEVRYGGQISEANPPSSSRSPSLQERSTPSSQTGLLMERSMSQEANASVPELRRRSSEPRRGSLELDIHINEPNIVPLQDSLLARKPLCDEFNEKQPSEAQRSLSPSQQVVRFVSSSSLNAIPPQPQCSPLGPELSAEGQRRPSEVANVSFKNRRKLEDGLNVKLQISDGKATASLGNLEAEGERAELPMASPGVGEKKPVRTTSLSKELVKTETKSWLHPPTPGSIAPLSAATIASGPLSDAEKNPGANAPVSVATIASGPISEAEKIGSPSSPVRPSARKVEAEREEEDPFKDIDVKDEFRHGKFTVMGVAQWVALFAVMGCLICSVTVSAVKGRQLWGLELWKWFLLVLVVLCGRLVSGWIIRILVIIFEMNFLMRKKVLYFVYGLRKGVQNCLWLGLVLLAWKLMFDPHMKSSTSTHKVLLLVTRLLECFVIAAIIWLAKILLVKSLASSFHVTTFFDRIQESLFNQHVLETLSGPPLLNFAFEPLPFHGKRAVAGTQEDLKTDANISIDDLKKMSTHNVSAGLMTRLMHLVRHPGLSTLVTTIDESVCVDQDSEDIEINSELEAKAAAMRIFKNVAQRDSMSIEREDLLRFVAVDEVSKVLCLFEGGKETGKITKKALKNWVVNVYQERKALAHSLNDTKTAVKELHRMASVLVIIIIIVVWLLILGIATTKVLVFLSSQLLLVAFIFSNTLKQVFEAIIFLFVMHPFDVGDRCFIDGIQMVVEEMKILSTVFLKADNEKVFYPNSVLATKPISNLHRSPNMKDFLDFSVHISTPAEKIAALQKQITIYAEGKSEQWHPKVGLVVKELEDLNCMQVSVTMQHTINFQNFGERMNRRSDLLLEIKRIFAELGIEYRLLPQPVVLSYPSPQLMPSQLLSPPIYSAHFT